MVFFLDILPEEGLSKAKQNSSMHYSFQDGDRIEMEGLDFQRRVREGYFRLALQYSKTFEIVKGDRSIQEIGKTIYDLAKRRLISD